MGKIVQILLTFIVVLSGYSCAHKGDQSEYTPEQQIPENAGTLLYLEEKSKNEPDRLVRMIITKNYLRMDEGKDKEDYILFDRQKKIIFNVVTEDQSVMVMEGKSPENFNVKKVNWEVISQNSNALMRADPSTKSGATHHQFNVNNKKCYDVVALNDVLGEEARALSEYYSVLANELKFSYSSSVETQCFDAINIIEPQKRYSLGFPYREWSTYGYQRFLKNYQERVIFPGTLFEVPGNFHRY